MTASRRVSLLTLVALTSLGGLLGAQVAVAAPSPSPSAAAQEATGPTAVDDAATVGLGGSVRLAGATNDHAGSAALRPAVTMFPSDQLSSLPKGSAIDQGGRRLQVVNHGTFQVNQADGSITFTPWTGRTGNVSVRYRITDTNGATDDGLLHVVVTAGGTLDEVTAYRGNDVVGVDLLTNDVPGRNADGTPGSIDRASARFSDQQPGPGVTISNGGRTATVTEVGVLTLDATGLLTLHAQSSSSDFSGSTSVFYSAQDTTVAADGSLAHHAYVGQVRATADANAVLVKDDRLATPLDAPLTFPGILSDHPSDPTLVLRPELSQFFDFGVGPDDYLSPDKRTIRFANRGTLSINPDGTVRYVPPKGFVGVDGVDMFVFDNLGNRGQQELIVTVEPGPSAKQDSSTIAQNVTTPVAVLENDVPGKGVDGQGTMDATYVRFPTDGQPAGATVSAYQRLLTVPGQGVYTADRVTGAITFDPEPAFVGRASPVRYSAQDTVKRQDGAVLHRPVGSTLTVTVTAVSPVALNNWATTTAGKPVDVPVLGNDKPGAASAPLVPASIRLRLAPGLPDGSSLSGDAKTLTVKGQGTFKARTDGVVVFTPVKDFVGRVATIGYQVSDANGTYARATITVQVAA